MTASLSTELSVLVYGIAAGASADPPARAGLAHVVEHFVMGALSCPDTGWVTNAMTTADLTLYEACMPTRLLPPARAQLLAVLTAPLTVTRLDLERELRVIDLEERGGGGSPAVLGTAAEREHITSHEIRAFHDEHYRTSPPHEVVVRPAGGEEEVEHDGGRKAGWRSVHVRHSEKLTQVVVLHEARDPGHAATLLATACTVHSELGRVLALPIVSGHTRTVVHGGATLAVSARLTVGPSTMALAISVAGDVTRAERLDWLDVKLRGRSSVPTPIVHPDPVLRGRWRCFWDLSVDGGWRAVRDSQQAMTTETFTVLADAVREMGDV